MRLTLVHPCVGRRRGQPYIRTWQMEPLAPATIAGLDAREIRASRSASTTIARRAIPFDEPTDLVAMSVETYTAKRSYQIASEFRRRGVPVVMGGFHPTLVPEEASEYAEAIVIGEAEGVWPSVLDDFRSGPPAARLPPGAASAAHRPAAGSVDLRRQALPARRTGRSGTGLPFPLRVLRHPVLLRQHADAPAERRNPRGSPAREEAADLLRRRQHHVEHGSGQGILSRADPVEGALGEPGQHQRRARRGIPAADQGQRLPGTAHRLRVAQPERT